MGRPEMPMFRAFWMWKDRYLITYCSKWDGDIASVSLYAEGELLTDGNLYGNDF